MDDAIDRTIGINTFIIPTRNELRNDPFKNFRGNPTSDFIEDLERRLVNRCFSVEDDLISLGSNVTVTMGLAVNVLHDSKQVVEKDSTYIGEMVLG